MSPKRRNVELAMAALFAVAILAAGGLAIFVAVAEPPVHPDPAAIPATTAAAPAERYAGAVEDARRRARTRLVQEELAPNLSVAVAKDGEIVWAEAFGYAELARHTPATPRTRFRLGSVSKTMTAMAVARLYEGGKIDLDAPIQTYVSAYPRKQWTVTPRQLLGDVAGVHRIRGEGNDPPPRGQCRSLDQALPIFSTEPLLFEPGTQYKFSTFGWILLSAAVEGAAGAPFPAVMRREVFEPLGMDRTAIEGTDTDADVVAFRVPSAESADDEPQDPPAADYGCTYGAGAFLSTPSDLVRLGSAMLSTSADASAVAAAPADKTAVRKPGLLKAATIELFQTPLTLADGASTGFALGWKVDRIPLAGAQVRVVRHRASFIGGGASLLVFPDLGLAVAATSSINPIAAGPFALEVAEAFAKSN